MRGRKLLLDEVFFHYSLRLNSFSYFGKRTCDVISALLIFCFKFAQSYFRYVSNIACYFLLDDITVVLTLCAVVLIRLTTQAGFDI